MVKSKVEGVFIPIVTPFSNGKVDFKSYKNLIDHYISKGISGIIPLATTGESPTISELEYEEILEKVVEFNNNRVPIYFGLGSNNTQNVIDKLKLVEKYNVDGILSIAPYYNRPTQDGIYNHFYSISQSTNLDILLYNIPSRTGINIENETLYKLAELKNIIGVKDASNNIKQTLELLSNSPEGFSILTGEDEFFFINLIYGGNGGILASAHLQTETFIDIYRKIKNNDYDNALKEWIELSNFIPLLFQETNPIPIKYCLNKLNLIDSSEVRLPLTQVSTALAKKLDNNIVSKYINM